MLGGTEHFVKLAKRRKEAKFWMGITPGRMGMSMPAESEGKSSIATLTSSAHTGHPALKLANVVEQLGDDKVGTGINLDLEVVQVRLDALRVGMRGGVARNTDTEVVAVLLANVADEIIGMFKLVKVVIRVDGVLVSAGRVTSEGEDVLDPNVAAALCGNGVSYRACFLARARRPAITKSNNNNKRTCRALSTFSIGMLVHVKWRMTSMPILTMASARSRERSAVEPPAPQVTETASGALRGAAERRPIRSRRFARPGSVRGGKNSYVWNGPCLEVMRDVRWGMAGWVAGVPRLLWWALVLL